MYTHIMPGILHMKMKWDSFYNDPGHVNCILMKCSGIHFTTCELREKETGVV